MNLNGLHIFSLRIVQFQRSIDCRFPKPNLGHLGFGVRLISVNYSPSRSNKLCSAEDWNGLSASATEAKYDARIRSGGSLLALNHETYGTCSKAQ